MAGFEHFDPDKWEAAKPAKPAKAEPSLATLATLATLPDDLADGLRRLSGMVAPSARADIWAAVIQDAARLVDGGWALSALQLGWSPHDLFGAVTSKDGDAASDGLAVRLAGRPLLAICASFATVRDPNNGRSYLYRGSTEGARLLWELGRGR